jgi:hypothetical protein
MTIIYTINNPYLFTSTITGKVVFTNITHS